MSRFDWVRGRVLWGRGKNQAQIARALGCTQSAVSYAATREHWPKHQRYDWGYGRRLWLCGYTNEAIAEALGCTQPAVGDAAARLGWPMRIRVYAFPELKIYSPHIEGVGMLTAHIAGPR